MKSGKKMKKSGFLKGAAIIAAGGFISKLIGALYRVPLTNLIGSRGLGLYQMAYPFYCLLLTVSATGIPSSIASLTAARFSKGESDKGVLKTALKLFTVIGATLTVAMFLLAPVLSKAQGEPSLKAGYYALAPAVLLVSVISVFRGFFQGRNRMAPTAGSEIIEQAVKVGIGLALAYFFRSSVERAVALLLLAVSLSELVAMLFMLFCYKRTRNTFDGLKGTGKTSVKRILKMSIPVTLNAALIPLSGMVDSVLIVRLLSRHTADAVALYGLFAGGAVTVINLPVSICYGIAAASIPAVGAAKSVGKSERKRVLYSLFITLLVSVPCALALYFFAEPTVSLIFRSLGGAEKQTLARLVKLFSVSAVTLSCAQTLSACLTARGKPQYATFSMFLGIVAKTVLSFWLVADPRFQVYGAAIATNVCYLLAFALDLMYNLCMKSSKNGRGRQKECAEDDCDSGTRREEGGFDGER